MVGKEHAIAVLFLSARIGGPDIRQPQNAYNERVMTVATWLA